MEKLQAKGEIDEDQLKALEMDVTGKVASFTPRYYENSSEFFI
jgi:hypothetical protein